MHGDQMRDAHTVDPIQLLEEEEEEEQKLRVCVGGM